MEELFAEVLAVSGHQQIEYFEHVEVSYVKKDMSKVGIVITIVKLQPKPKLKIGCCRIPGWIDFVFP